MNWLNKLLIGVLATSSISLPIATHAENEFVFEGCVSNLDYKAKRTMEWIGAWPVSLSDVPENIDDIRRFKHSIDEFELDVVNFHETYKAALNIAKEHCPHDKGYIGSTLRRRFVGANAILHELKYAAKLVETYSQYRDANMKVEKHLRNASQLKAQLEGK
jgi:hypothetical protein